VWFGREAPRWPSFMAVVERAEREVVVELGVPGASEGVSLADGGGGRFISVGVGLDIVCAFPGSKEGSFQI